MSLRPTTSRDDWREIMALLDTALELDPAARPAWLASLRSEHAHLVPALQQLLDDQPAVAASGFLDAPADVALDASTHGSANAPAAAPVVTALAPQSLVGPYRLLREIGQGGMASVWLAERADGLLERRVALKLPHVSWGSGSFAERMARERNILASLTHPNIARLYDAGLADDGRPFLALEYVDGQPIDTYAAVRGLGTPARVELVVQVARAVAHAHAQLVVHRDLKPSNILVDASGRAHLLDFGIAKLVDPAEGDAAEGTPPAQATQLLGRALTPDYASPEQIRGDAIGTASDVYSMGVVAFELLAGARPYRLKRGLGAAALAEAIARVEVPSASAKAADERVRRELSGDLDAILARTLAKAPNERYATIDALANDLERHLRGEPVRVRAASRAYVADRWVRRHKVETAIVLALLLAALGGAYAQVLVLLALGAGVVAALWQRNHALRQAELARTALARGEQVKDFIASIFTQAVPRAGRGGAVAAADLLRAAARRVETDLAGQPIVAAELGALIGASFNELGEVGEGLAWLPKAVERCTRELGATHRLTLQSRWRWAEAANSMGELTVSEPLLPALVSDLRAAKPPEPALLVRALQSQAFVHTKRGREAQAMAALNEAVEVATLRLGEGSDEALSARASLSNTCMHFGRSAEALEAIAPALVLARARFGAQRPQLLLAAVERNHADAMTATQRPREAAAVLRQVLADQRALDADETLRVQVAMQMLARALTFGAHFQEAIAWYEEALRLQERLSSGFNHAGVQLLSAAGLACALRGDGGAALAHVERAAEQAASLGEAEVHTRMRHATRVLAWALTDRHDEVLATTDPLMTGPEPLPGVVALRMLRARARVMRQLGRTSEALAAVQRALSAAIGRDCLALDHGLALAEAAHCHVAAGDAAAAGRHWTDALAVWAAGQVDGPEVLQPVQDDLAALRGPIERG